MGDAVYLLAADSLPHNWFVYMYTCFCNLASRVRFSLFLNSDLQLASVRETCALNNAQRNRTCLSGCVRLPDLYTCAKYPNGELGYRSLYISIVRREFVFHGTNPNVCRVRKNTGRILCAQVSAKIRCCTFQAHHSQSWHAPENVLGRLKHSQASVADVENAHETVRSC